MAKDVIATIRADHDEVRRLFSEIELAGGDDQRRLALCRDIVRLLSQHDVAEELELWPRARACGLEALIRDRLGEEHELVEELHNLSRATPHEIDFDAKIARVKTLVQQHMAHEEERLLPELASVLREHELSELGERFASARDRAPTRPHPLVPNEGVGLDVAARASAPLDRLRDRARG